MPPADSAALAAVVIAQPLRWRADSLAHRIGLDAATRRRLAITTTGATDETSEQRAARRSISNASAIAPAAGTRPQP